MRIRRILVSGTGPKRPPPELKNKADAEVQFLEWPLEAGSKSKSSPTEPHVKMANFIAEINMLTAWYTQWFWSLWPISPFKFYITYSFKLY